MLFSVGPLSDERDLVEQTARSGVVLDHPHHETDVDADRAGVVGVEVEIACLLLETILPGRRYRTNRSSSSSRPAPA